MYNNSEYFLKGSGTPVVMLHSSMSSKRQWVSLSETLCSSHQMIAVDLFGYGRGPFPDNPSSFSLEQEAERIKTILFDLLGDQRFHLVGHSYGGAAALRLAYSNQERLLSMSLFEPVAFHLLPKDSPLLQAVIDVAANIEMALGSMDYSAAAKIFVDYWSGAGTYDKLERERRRTLDVLIPKVVLDFQAGIYEPLSLDNYKALNTPTCLIAGRNSRPVTQQITMALGDAIARSHLHWLDGGHMAPVTHAADVNSVILKFISSLGDVPS